MHDYSNNHLPVIFDNTWQKNRDIHHYPVRNQNDFYISVINKPYLNQLPLFFFPKVWNSLPTELKTIVSRKVFAKHLYKHLIDNIAI